MPRRGRAASAATAPVRRELLVQVETGGKSPAEVPPA